MTPTSRAQFSDTTGPGGLVTYDTRFVIEWHSHRVQVVGGTSYPDEAFVLQAMRHLIDGTDGVMRSGSHYPGRFLIRDRDPKWRDAVVAFLAREGIRLIQTPPPAPHCNRIEPSVDM